jgi:2'-5' RNA ligase
MRTFIAFTLPDEAANQIIEWQQANIPQGVYPEPVTNLHMTLAFLGDTPDELVPQINQILAGLDVSQVFIEGPIKYEEQAKLAFLTYKETGGSAVWEQLNAALKDLMGYEPQFSPWLPHTTVWRFAPDHKPNINPPLPNLSFQPIAVTLYQSVRNENGQGATYQHVGSRNTRRSNIMDPVMPTLDQRVFKDEVPRSGVQSFIKKIYYKAFEKHFGIPAAGLINLYMTGSLTTYQYSDTSDSDIGVFPNYPEIQKRLGLDPAEVRKELVAMSIGSLDGTFLPGGSHPLQFFVMNPGATPEETYKHGVRSGYSLDSHEWVNPPEKDRVHDVQVEFPEMYRRAEAMAQKMRDMLDHDPDKARELWKQIHAKRSLDEQAGLGDFSEGNITYKYLLHEGLFDRIRKELGEYIASEKIARTTMYHVTWEPHDKLMQEGLDYRKKPSVNWDHPEFRRQNPWYRPGNYLWDTLDNAKTYNDFYGGNGNIYAVDASGVRLNQDPYFHQLDPDDIDYQDFIGPHGYHGAFFTQDPISPDRLHLLDSGGGNRSYDYANNRLLGSQEPTGWSPSMPPEVLDRFLHAHECPWCHGNLQETPTGYYCPSCGSDFNKTAAEDDYSIIDPEASDEGVIKFLVGQIRGMQGNVEKVRAFFVNYSQLFTPEKRSELVDKAAVIYQQEKEKNDAHAEEVRQMLLNRPKAIEVRWAYYKGRVIVEDNPNKGGSLIHYDMLEQLGVNEDDLYEHHELYSDDPTQTRVQDLYLGYADYYPTSGQVEITEGSYDYGEKNLPPQVEEVITNAIRSEMSKTSAFNDDSMKVIYNFEQDHIILGTISQDEAASTKIIGDYDGSNVTLYQDAHQWLNANYFRRLWAHSFPKRRLHNVFLDSGKGPKHIPSRDPKKSGASQAFKYTDVAYETAFIYLGSPYNKLLIGGSEHKDLLENFVLSLINKPYDWDSPEVHGQYHQIMEDLISVPMVYGHIGAETDLGEDGEDPGSLRYYKVYSDFIQNAKQDPRLIDKALFELKEHYPNIQEYQGARQWWVGPGAEDASA